MKSPRFILASPFLASLVDAGTETHCALRLRDGALMSIGFLEAPPGGGSGSAGRAPWRASLLRPRAERAVYAVNWAFLRVFPAALWSS